MKKLISILLAATMLFTIVGAATAEEVPQPEGGKKFESDWAFRGGLAEIYYEEEGYRVTLFIENTEDSSGTEWEYSCHYSEEADALISVSSSKTEYTYNEETGDKEYKDDTYNDFDDENTYTEFTVDENGCLLWKDGHENAGADLQFSNIGRFEGLWRNVSEAIEAEFTWNGLADEERFEYTVYITSGSDQADSYAQYLMTGEYDPATGKLTARGTCTLFTKNDKGEFDSSDDGEEYEAVFSKTEDGKLLYETDNGIELEYDILGGVG